MAYLIQSRRSDGSLNVYASSEFSAEASRLAEIMNLDRHTDLVEVVPIPNARDILNPAQPWEYK